MAHEVAGLQQDVSRSGFGHAARLRILSYKGKPLMTEHRMTPARIAIAAALASALALPVAVQAQGKVEKCYGVAKAGKNDCQTAASSCAGTSKKDGQPDAWIAVPRGTCEKIVGGMVKG
jgi:uncharacterized membrane protein